MFYFMFYHCRLSWFFWETLFLWVSWWAEVISLSPEFKRGNFLNLFHHFWPLKIISLLKSVCKHSDSLKSLSGQRCFLKFFFSFHHFDLQRNNVSLLNNSLRSLSQFMARRDLVLARCFLNKMTSYDIHQWHNDSPMICVYLRILLLFPLICLYFPSVSMKNYKKYHENLQSYKNLSRPQKLWSQQANKSVSKSHRGQEKLILHPPCMWDDETERPVTCSSPFPYKSYRNVNSSSSGWGHLPQCEAGWPQCLLPALFGKNVCKNERIRSSGGGHAPVALPGSATVFACICRGARHVSTLPAPKQRDPILSFSPKSTRCRHPSMGRSPFGNPGSANSLSIVLYETSKVVNKPCDTFWYHRHNEGHMFEDGESAKKSS